MKLTACHTLKRLPLTGTWFRAVELRFLNNPLGTKHTLKFQGRFSPARETDDPFELLYLCQHPVLALQEVDAVFGRLSPNQLLADPNRAWALLNVRVQLEAIVDISEPSQQRLLQTSLQELTGSWRTKLPQSSLAPTQLLARSLYKLADVEGFLAPSAKSPAEKCLNLFPKKTAPR